MTQREPTTLIPSLAIPTYTKAGRPVLILDSEDKEYAHQKVWEAWLLEVKKPDTYPVVRNLATEGAVESRATNPMDEVEACDTSRCILRKRHGGLHATAKGEDFETKPLDVE